MSSDWPRLSRRTLLLSGLCGPLSRTAANATNPAEPAILFPRDLGSHSQFAIEWWYLSGFLRATSSAREYGFQVTFFRSRPPATQAMSSAFAAKQLWFAHAAVSDLTQKKFCFDQRIARQGFGVAYASETDTAVHLHDWSLIRQGATYQTTVAGDSFQFDLSLEKIQSPLLQGDLGRSQKGPQAQYTSLYYSVPQLQAKGVLVVGGQRLSTQGTAWLDHEWSHSLLPPDAVGWDWIGMNLFDGGALTAFRLRDRFGQTLWSGGSWRSGSDGRASTAQMFAPDGVAFHAVRFWRSPLSHVRYPVEWRIETPVGHYIVNASIDDQELDSRATTGALYWEGLSDLLDGQAHRVGRGYLEMTGYAHALRL